MKVGRFLGLTGGNEGRTHLMGEWSLQLFILQTHSLAITNNLALFSISSSSFEVTYTSFQFSSWINRYGITRVLEGGDLLEKAAANVSIVRGHLSEARTKAGTIQSLYLIFVPFGLWTLDLT